MNRILGLSGIKNLEQYRSTSASKSGALNPKVLSSSATVSSSDSGSSGSFANLKLTAEKLVKEQASARTDLEIANSKLKKLTEQIRVLEEKLQNAFNENAKLKVKQQEDEKLWEGIESKFSSTKTLCDQLNETLHLLIIQVQNAEKDKAYFEDKLSTTSDTLDKLHEHMQSMSLSLSSSEETVKAREKELIELGHAKERMETSLRDEQNRAAILIEEKDGMIKQLEEAVVANKVAMESLTSKMEDLHMEKRVKEDELQVLWNSKEILEKENMDLLSSKNDFANNLDMALKEVKNLEDFVKVLVVKFTELENQTLTFSEKAIQLNASYDLCLKLAQQEKELVSQSAQQKFDQIHHQYLCITSEKNSLQLLNQELNDKVLERQKDQEFAMVQHAEECRLAEEKNRKLESEAKTLLSKQTEMEALIATLEDNAKISQENSRLSANEMQDLLLKLSELEKESRSVTDGLKEKILEKEGEIDLLLKEIKESEDKKESLEKRICELENAVEEKDQLVLVLETREKQFEDQKAEITKSLADKESELEEAKRKHDQMLESKQLELSKHLKEISQRNDQAINDIRRKYEADKQESVNLEKQKGEKSIQDLEKQCEQKIAECKEESQRYLARVNEEHAAVICRIQQEHDKKEASLIAKHSEEIKCSQLQFETELREISASLRSEHEAQIRALRREHEDECRTLQEELNIQKAKEERQRTLLQLQWKVMSDNPQEDQEVNSKKHYSISSTKTRNSDGGKRNELALNTTDEEKDTRCLRATQMPAPSMSKNVEKGNTGTATDHAKHSRKVTHREYEIETSNGRTITKRKTKSTVMFGDSRKHRKRETPRAKTPREVVQGVKDRVRPAPSNIGDLFSEGSLNPYADDPYAFD